MKNKRRNYHLLWPSIVRSSFFPCKNFHDEYFVIFFHEILRMYTCIYLRFVGFYGLLYKAGDILLVFRKQRSVFHAVNRDDR